MAKKLSKKKLQVLQALSSGPKSTTAVQGETGLRKTSLFLVLSSLYTDDYLIYDNDRDIHWLSRKGRTALESR